MWLFVLSSPSDPYRWRFVSFRFRKALQSNQLLPSVLYFEVRRWRGSRLLREAANHSEEGWPCSTGKIRKFFMLFGGCSVVTLSDAESRTFVRVISRAWSVSRYVEFASIMRWVVNSKQLPTVIMLTTRAATSSQVVTLIFPDSSWITKLNTARFRLSLPRRLSVVWEETRPYRDLPMVFVCSVAILSLPPKFFRMNFRLDAFLSDLCSWRYSENTLLLCDALRIRTSDSAYVVSSRLFPMQIVGRMFEGPGLQCFALLEFMKTHCELRSFFWWGSSDIASGGF